MGPIATSERVKRAIEKRGLITKIPNVELAVDPDVPDNGPLKTKKNCIVM